MKSSKTLKETASKLLVTELHNTTPSHWLPSGTTMSSALTYRWTLANRGQSGITSFKISYWCNHHSSWLMWIVRQNYGGKIRILHKESFKPMSNKFPIRTNASSTPYSGLPLLVVGKRLKKEGSTVPSDFPPWSFPSTRTLIVYSITAALWENGMTQRSESQGSGSFTFCMEWDTAEDSQGTQ